MSQYKYPVNKGFKWFAKFNYVDPIDGKIKTKLKRGFENKRDAKKYEEEFLENLTIPEEDEKEVTKTFGDVFQEYLTSHKHSDIKESTLQTKFNIFNKHIFPTFENMPIKEIDEDIIADWQDEIKEKGLPNGKPFSDAYLRTIQCQFNSIINYAKNKGYITLNPLTDIKNMGTKSVRVKFWTLEEYEKFSYKAMNYPRYYYAYEILYWCGIREGELLALTPEDFDFERQTLSITKSYQRLKGQDVISAPKTEKSVRIIKMPSFLCDEVRDLIRMSYQIKSGDRLFPVTKYYLHHEMNRGTEKAGIKRIRIHDLRHSHVSLLIDMGFSAIAIADRMGHESIDITLNYAHLFPSRQSEMADRLEKERKGDVSCLEK